MTGRPGGPAGVYAPRCSPWLPGGASDLADPTAKDAVEGWERDRQQTGTRWRSPGRGPGADKVGEKLPRWSEVTVERWDFATLADAPVRRPRASKIGSPQP